MYLLGTSRHARFSFLNLEQASDTASLVLAGTGVRAVSFFGVLMNRALTTSWFWCCTLRNGSCLGGTVLLRGVVSAFFLALEGSTLVRGGDACRVQIRWILGLGLSPAAFSAASVPARTGPSVASAVQSAGISALNCTK
jgi:hypothetical protein